MRVIVVSAILLIAACAPNTVIMKNPQTNEVAQCVSTVGGFFPILAAQQVNDCVTGYEKAGWARMQ